MLSGTLGNGSYRAGGQLRPQPLLATLQISARVIDIAPLQSLITVPLNMRIGSALLGLDGHLLPGSRRGACARRLPRRAHAGPGARARQTHRRRFPALAFAGGLEADGAGRADPDRPDHPQPRPALLQRQIHQAELHGPDLDYVEFAPGSAVLDAAAQSRLAGLVQLLRQKPSLKLDITGRMDPAFDEKGLRQVIALHPPLPDAKGIHDKGRTTRVDFGLH